MMPGDFLSSTVPCLFNYCFFVTNVNTSRHCTLALNDTTLIVFGGGSDADPENYSKDRRWVRRAPLKQSHTGFFLTFPNPLTPHNYSYTKVQF